MPLNFVNVICAKTECAYQAQGKCDNKEIRLDKDGVCRSWRVGFDPDSPEHERDLQEN